MRYHSQVRSYRGFPAAQRRRALRWLRAAGTLPRSSCDLCGASPGWPHSESYAEPFGPHIGAYSLCSRCHRLVHNRVRYPQAWARLVECAREIGREAVATAIERGDPFPPVPG